MKELPGNSQAFKSVLGNIPGTIVIRIEAV
jgi:hypothetical protein